LVAAVDDRILRRIPRHRNLFDDVVLVALHNDQWNDDEGARDDEDEVFVDTRLSAVHLHPKDLHPEMTTMCAVSAIADDIPFHVACTRSCHQMNMAIPFRSAVLSKAA
jgi:hypothetical protein